MWFFRGLLFVVRFAADGQAKGQMQRSGGSAIVSATNGSVHATYTIDPNQDQSAFTITMGVFDEKAIAAKDDRVAFVKFIGESAGLEFKHKEADKASGF